MKRKANPSADIQHVETGSPPSSEPVFLIVGRVLRSHGVLGELRMEVLTDFPERLRKGTTVYLGNEHQPHRLAGIRAADHARLIRLENISDRNQADLLRGKEVFIEASRLPALPEDEYYFHQLIGMQVLDEAGGTVGTLEQILETGANDVYIVRTLAGEEVLLPAIESVILKVDIENRQMTVRLPDWE